MIFELLMIVAICVPIAAVGAVAMYFIGFGAHDRDADHSDGSDLMKRVNRKEDEWIAFDRMHYQDRAMRTSSEDYAFMND